jgi:hypothetical protein
MSAYKITSEGLREAKTFQKAAKAGKLKWQKKKNPMSHLMPKKKKK